MKTKDVNQLRQKTVPELYTLLKATQGETARLAIEKESGKLKDTQAVNKKRKYIAIIKTIIGEKELVK